MALLGTYVLSDLPNDDLLNGENRGEAYRRGKRAEYKAKRQGQEQRGLTDY